eukprot:TRINITY_DN81176_c0_g1_i1.p1 TRINITY_DN81176_c0_g1~~TRINITY_DN81176_c0_g1_i1.p1  ORF type:complete len:552 (-),score=92.12 TRINITY_DN81176_c0_g1_i1:15-1670(-)
MSQSMQAEAKGKRKRNPHWCVILCDRCCCDPESVYCWPYHIPCCGGYCAPTENPDKSCLRRVSNEFTLPAGLGGWGPFMRCGNGVEFNRCCRLFGMLGLPMAEKYRKGVMSFGALCTSLAFLFLVLGIFGGLACPAYFRPASVDVLKAGHWLYARGDMALPAWNGTALMRGQGLVVDVRVYMGLWMRYSEVDCQSAKEAAKLCQMLFSSLEGWKPLGTSAFGQALLWEAESCRNGPIGSISNELCAQCTKLCETCGASSFDVVLLFFTLAASQPSLQADLQRTTEFGDMNCQANIGLWINVLALLGGLWPVLRFVMYCYREMQGSFPELGFQLGPGLIFILMALIMKLLDSCLHALVPTPASRWKAPAEPLDLLTYMHGGVRPSPTEKDRLMSETLGASSSVDLDDAATPGAPASGGSSPARAEMGSVVAGSTSSSSAPHDSAPLPLQRSLPDLRVSGLEKKDVTPHADSSSLLLSAVLGSSDPRPSSPALDATIKLNAPEQMTFTQLAARVESDDERGQSAGIVKVRPLSPQGASRNLKRVKATVTTLPM